MSTEQTKPVSTKLREILERAKRNASGCTCGPAYKSREMSDPDCAACEFHEVVQCVDEALSELEALELRDQAKGEPVSSIVEAAPAPTARVLTNEEIERLSNIVLPLRPADFNTHKETMAAVIGAQKAMRYLRDNGYLSSPKPQVSVDEIMEVVDKEHPTTVGHGWDHIDIERAKARIRAGITKLMGQ